MTRPDNDELKRLAEGARAARLAYDDAAVGNVVVLSCAADEALEALDAACQPHEDTLIALLSEIEGLKAERDEWMIEVCDRLGLDTSGKWSPLDVFKHVEENLRTQAPDSWRPIAEHDNSADEVLVMAEGWTKPIVAWRHHPSSRTDMWLTVPGKYLVKPTEFCPLPAIRPQTAESGK
jgi:hypothetical protein